MPVLAIGLVSGVAVALLGGTRDERPKASLPEGNVDAHRDSARQATSSKSVGRATSSPSGPIAGLSYFTVAPCRVADTRNSPGPYGGPALVASATRIFAIAGQCGIPLTAQAVSLNVTITEPTGPGHLTLYPAGAPLPLASTINYRPGQVSANNAIVRLGAGGNLAVFSGQGSGTTHFVIDVNGYFEPSAITWSEAQVDLGISLGERVSWTLTFTSSQALKDVAVQIPPEVAPFLAFEPNVFATVQANTAQTVRLSFSSPVNPSALGEHHGTVQLMQGSQIIPQILMVSLTIFDDAVPPPDPGAAGRATLEGIDSDRDGVRDDVQRYISLTHPASRKTRAGLRQWARWAQASILQTTDREASIAYTIELFHAQDCLRYTSPTGYPAVKDEVFARMLNTRDRSRAWLAADKHFSGQVYRSTAEDRRRAQCQFDIDGMEN